MGRVVVAAVTIAAVVLIPGVAAAAPARPSDAAGSGSAAGSASATTSPSPSPSLAGSPPDGKVTIPAGSLVRTGGFEPPDVEEISGYDTYTAAKYPDLGAWRITAGSVDLIGAGWEEAAEGKQYVDLNGNDGDGTAATLTQTLHTTSGRRYRLEFLLAGNPHGDPPVKNLDVQFGSVSKSLTTNEASGDTLNWQQVELDADACSDSTVLTFTSRTQGQRGPLIDAVSVVDVGGAVLCGAAGAALWQVLLLTGLGVAWVAAMVALGAAILRRRTALAARG